MKGLLYLLISNDSSPSPIGQVSLASGNLQLLSLKILEKLKNEKNTSKAYIYDDYIFHYHNSNSLTLILLTDKEYSNRFAYHFIFLTRDRLFQDFGDDIKSAIAFSIDQSYLSTIKQSMIKYSDPENLDNFSVINKNIQDVKEIMLQNIEKIIERGEKIQLLVIKSEELEVNARVFKKKAYENHRHFCCQHLKTILLVTFLVLAIIVVSILLLCGGTDLHKCKHYLPNHTP